MSLDVNIGPNNKYLWIIDFDRSKYHGRILLIIFQISLSFPYRTSFSFSTGIRLKISVSLNDWILIEAYNLDFYQPLWSSLFECSFVCWCSSLLSGKFLLPYLFLNETSFHADQGKRECWKRPAFPWWLGAALKTNTQQRRLRAKRENNRNKFH